MKIKLLICCLPFIGLAACEKDNPMSYNPVPETNVELEIVSDTISSTDFLPDFYEDEDINMFAKKKPVNYDSDFPDDTVEWWKAYNGNCGIIFPKVGSISQVPNVNWTYDRVGGSFPRRLNDFVGYKHDAVPFLQYGASDIKINTYALPNSFTIRGTIVESSKYQLGYTDFNTGELSECYLTSCIKKGSSYWIKSAATKLFEGESGLTITWDWSEFGENPPSRGTYNIYMILSPKQYVPRVALADITNNTIIPVWHDSTYRNPFRLDIVSNPPITFILNRLGSYSGGGDLKTTSYYTLDASKLEYDEFGNPMYYGNNALHSSGYCFVELKVTNNFDTVQQFNAADIYMAASNFKNQTSKRMPVRLYTDINLKNIINGNMSIPAKSTVTLYAGRNIFNINKDGSQFYPEGSATIAPANIYFYQGLNGGALGSAVGLVVEY